MVRYRWWEDSLGHFFLEAVALEDAMPAPAPGVVRIEAMRTLWRLVPQGQDTEVLYTYRGELGVPLPEWVVKIGWRSETKRVIEALAAEVKRVGAADR